MNPVSHLLTGWVAASTADLTARDRALVTLAGVAAGYRRPGCYC